MKLNVLERIMLSNVLPREGNFANLKLIRVAKEEISFTDEENRLLNFRPNDVGGTTWTESIVLNKDTGKPVKGDQQAVQAMVQNNPHLFEMKPVVDEKEFKFGETITKLIVDSLKNLNDQQKLTEQHFSIYEKFMEIHALP